MDRTQAFARFKDAIRHVWGEQGLAHVEGVTKLGADQPRGDFLAALVYARRPFGMRGGSGNHLITRAPAYMLLLADRLLAMDDESVWKILVHEAVHVGVAGHDRTFREICRAAGGAVSESSLESGNVVSIQRQDAPGKRFHTVHTVESEENALKWVLEERKTRPGRYRTLMGLADGGDDDAQDLDAQLGAVIIPAGGSYSNVIRQSTSTIGLAKNYIDAVLSSLGRFVPTGINSSIINLLALSFDDDFLLEGGKVPPRKLRDDARIAWQGLDEANMLADVLEPQDAQMIENPDLYTVPQPLVEWARLVLPHAYAAEKAYVSELFPFDANRIYYPSLVFPASTKAGFKAGRHWLAFYWKRPGSCSPAIWDAVRSHLEAFWRAADVGARHSVAPQNFFARAVVAALPDDQTSPCSKTLRGLSIENPVTVTTEQIIAKLGASSRLTPFTHVAEVPVMSARPPFAGRIYTYEEAVAWYKQVRDEWARKKYLPTSPFESEHFGPAPVLEALVESAGPLYVGFPDYPDPDRRHVIVPPLVDAQQYAQDRALQQVSTFWKLSTVDPTGRPRLMKGITFGASSMHVDDDIAEKSDGLLRPGEYGVNHAFELDWEKVFTKFKEDDDERIQEAELEEFDSLCWPQGSRLTKEEALAWIQRHNNRVAAARVKGKTGKAALIYPEDWSGAYWNHDLPNKVKRVGITVPHSAASFSRVELPPMPVIIALGFLMISEDCEARAGTEPPNVTIPLWFSLACRRDGVPTGDDWIGHDRLVFFDYLYDLYRRAAPESGDHTSRPSPTNTRDERAEEMVRFLEENVGNRTVGALWRYYLGLYDNDLEIGPPEEIAASFHRDLNVLGKNLSFFRATKLPLDCRRGVGGRKFTCCRYRADKDMKLIALIPDGDGYLVIRLADQGSSLTASGDFRVGGDGLFQPVDMGIEERRREGKLPYAPDPTKDDLGGGSGLSEITGKPWPGVVNWLKEHGLELRKGERVQAFGFGASGSPVTITSNLKLDSSRFPEERNRYWYVFEDGFMAEADELQRLNTLGADRSPSEAVASVQLMLGPRKAWFRANARFVDSPPSSESKFNTAFTNGQKELDSWREMAARIGVTDAEAIVNAIDFAQTRLDQVHTLLDAAWESMADATPGEMERDEQAEAHGAIMSLAEKRWLEDTIYELVNDQDFDEDSVVQHLIHEQHVQVDEDRLRRLARKLRRS